MALVEGTNVGFVTVAPTADPEGAGIEITDNFVIATKFTAPTNGKVIEIGWWCNNATAEANFEVGLYSHDIVNDRPLTLLGSNKTNAKGTTSGWKVVSGLDITIVIGTRYWITYQLDNTVLPTNVDSTDGQGIKRDYRLGSTLPDPNWGVSVGQADRTIAVYALYKMGKFIKTRYIAVDKGLAPHEREAIKRQIADLTTEDKSQMEKSTRDIMKDFE